jgi:glutamine amidotransferase
MCRLLGWAATEPTPVVELLGDAELSRLVALSRFHADGWGLSNGADVLCRSTTAAYEDAEFPGAIATPTATGILHLRRASPGYAVAAHNTHPFAGDGWSFAHNGTIRGAERLDGVLEPAYRARRQGETDSELYFLVFLQRLSSGELPVDALRHTVSEIRERCGDNGLNAIACSATSLLAVQAARRAQPTRAALVELMGPGVADPGNGISPDHLADYFGLRLRVAGGAAVVASTGAPGETWQRLPDESVVVADLARRRVEVHGLEGRGAPVLSAPLA